MEMFLSVPFFLGAVCFASSFTIESGQTVNTTQNLSDDNDTGLIEAGGAIEVPATDSTNGVSMNSNGVDVTGQQLINNGTIIAPGADSAGVNNASGGDFATITNSGSIVVSNQNSAGIANGVNGALFRRSREKDKFMMRDE